ncbi:MAG: polyprenol monophosphomannose synthase [Nitrospira sp.]|nr:polyprenol monophosphomannose synthase [Nitrospira sp.]
MHFHHIHSSEEIPAHIEARGDEAFVTPTFELAEVLIARGADSARVAVSSLPPSDDHYPGYARIDPDGPLVPIHPFRFPHSVVIVLPTYNERQNLEALIHAIGRYLVADILVVDDNSPDGTGQLADALSRTAPHIHVLHRTKKEGLGPAYVAGFQWALARGYESIIEMDCDFSHAPWDLPRMVRLSATTDLVIGSRYVPGGGTENWNLRRRLVSKFGNAYVRAFLGSRIHDWTGGFRCFRRTLLAHMHTGDVKAKGYVFQVEMAWKAIQLGGTLHEMPIRFRDRVHGQSKLGWPTIFEALREVPRMCFQHRVIT